MGSLKGNWISLLLLKEIRIIVDYAGCPSCSYTKPTINGLKDIVTYFRVESYTKS